MKQSKKQPQVTRQALLAAAGEGFARTGYIGTGLGTVVAAAGVTKGALFHHFPDKQALALAWIDECLAPEVEAHWLAPLRDADGLSTLRDVCRLRLDGLRPGDATATLAALAAELGVRDTVLGGRLEGIYDHWREAIAGLLERGQASGGVHRSIKPEAEAAFLVAVVAGTSVTAAWMPERTALRRCATALEDYLETLRSVPA